MKLRRTSSRAFCTFAGIGLAVEGVAAWLTYEWTAQVLLCQSAQNPPVLWPSGHACPAPQALFSPRSLIPAMLSGSIVVASVGLLAASLAGCFAEHYLYRRALARLVVEGSACPKAKGLSTASWPKRLVVVEADVATAYCIGLIKPRVVISTGLLRALQDDRLTAVLAHEASHERKRDPLRASLAKSLAKGLFFVPALRYLYKTMLVEQELVADREAVASVGRANLVAALIVLLDQPAPTGGVRTGRIVPPTAAAAAGRCGLAPRLYALETGGAPKLPTPLRPLLASAALLAALGVTAGWVPRYSSGRLLPPPLPACSRLPQHLARSKNSTYGLTPPALCRIVQSVRATTGGHSDPAGEGQRPTAKARENALRSVMSRRSLLARLGGAGILTALGAGLLDALGGRPASAWGAGFGQATGGGAITGPGGSPVPTPASSGGAITAPSSGPFPTAASTTVPAPAVGVPASSCPPGEVKCTLDEGACGGPCPSGHYCYKCPGDPPLCFASDGEPYICV
jgi:Zn-dependent protease with chaperone function